MTQSTGFDAAGQGSSGTDWRNNSTSSGGGSFAGGEGMSQSGRGAGFNEGSSDSQGWMPQSFGGGQAGDMLDSVREFGRNNRAATIGGGILAILALAGYASSSGKRHQDKRYRGSWESSGRSRHGDDDRFRREDYRGGRGYSRDSFSGSQGRYTGASSSGGDYGYGTLRRAGRYGKKHPVGLAAGAALGAMALSWLARGGWGQQGSSQGGSQGFGAAYGGRDFGGGQDFRSHSNEGAEGFRGGQSGVAGSGSSFGGSGSTASGGGFGAGSLGTQTFGSGSMGSDAIEAAGSSSDIGQGTTGSSFGRGRTTSNSASGGGL